MPRQRGIVVAVAAGLGLSLGTPSAGLAQAWLPPKGEAWFTLSYGNLYVKDHFFSQGERLDFGSIRSHSALADLGYSITDRFGVRVNLPYVASRYQGTFPHQLALDDGSIHGTFQDFRLEARFNALKGPVVLTPLVAAILPSHRYEYFGHAIAGMGVKQLLVGTAVGRRLDPFLPNAYVQGRYSYAFVERVEGVFHDRSNLDLQVGYFIRPPLQVFVLGMGQKTHGGLVFDRPVIRATWTAADFHHHGQISRSDLLGVGGGADYLVKPYLDVFGSYLTTVAGRNDHAMNAAISLGITFGFSPRQVMRRLSSPPTSPALTPGFSR